MAFTAGKSGNPKGREKGSMNKATAAMKERIETVLTELDGGLSADLQALRPDQRVELWAKLQEFIRPKLSRTAHQVEGAGVGTGVVTMQVVTGYLDASGKYVSTPPLRNDERDIDLD
jgi:hypothetical protein